VRTFLSPGLAGAAITRLAWTLDPNIMWRM
jgi:hypothetical protein